MNAYTVTTFGGIVKPRGSQFELVFIFRAGINSCVILKDNRASSFVLTLIDGPSGSGKTTFLGELYKHLSSKGAAPCAIRFDFNPFMGAAASVAVGYIPQNMQMVNHWRVSSLVSERSLFFRGFFPNEEFDVVRDKYLSELSGGQRKKIYACSMLDRLMAERADSVFGLLDETFDGLGAQEAHQCISMIRELWTAERPHHGLHIVLVTHLNEPELADLSLPHTSLAMAVRSSLSLKLVVEINAQHE